MKNLFLFCMVISLYWSCSPGDEQEFNVAGTLSDTNGVYIYLDELKSKSIQVKDSIKIGENGRFLIIGKIEEVGFYRLRISDDDFVNLVINPGDQLEITADATNLYNTYQIKGSKDAHLLYEFNDYIRKFNIQTDSLRIVAGTVYGKPNADSLNNLINSVYNQLLSERQSYARDFVQKNATSIASLAAIQSLEPEKDLKSYLKLKKELTVIYPNSEYVKNFNVQVERMSKLSIGSEAPQIVLNDPNGVTIPLASLRGKIVLIDFWASWCKPCRIENPNVVRLYNRYKDKGFEIYGVSLDKNKSNWVSAIQQDGLEWLQVSDLQFWNSSVVKLYDIKSIPQTYLIDEYGIIIAKGLRGQALEAKLAETLGGSK